MYHSHTSLSKGSMNIELFVLHHVPFKIALPTYLIDMIYLYIDKEIYSMDQGHCIGAKCRFLDGC